MGTHAIEGAKNRSNKYNQKLIDSAIKSTTDAINYASQRAIQETAEATGDLVVNKIAGKITSISKSFKTAFIENTFSKRG